MSLVDARGAKVQLDGYPTGLRVVNGLHDRHHCARLGQSGLRCALLPDGSMRLTDDRNLWVGEDLVVSEQVVPYISGDSAFEQQFIEFVTAVRLLETRSATFS